MVLDAVLIWFLPAFVVLVFGTVYIYVAHMKEYLIDWLQGTYPSVNRDRIFGLVRSVFGGGDFSERAYGLRYYRGSFQHPSGCVVGFDQRSLSGCVSPRDYLEFRGSVVGLLPVHRFRWLMRGLNFLGFKASRIDLTLDDFGWSYSIDDVRAAYERGDISGFRDTGKYVTSGRGGGRGSSFSLGNRGRSGSGKFIQFYDKNLESGGERDCIRCELSLYGDFAQQAFSDLLAVSIDDWPLTFRSYILVCVDFIDREFSSRADRSPRLSWWAHLIEDTIPIAIEPRHKDPDLLRRVDRWIRHQVAPSFSALFDIYHHQCGGDDSKWWEYFYTLLFDGESRRNLLLHDLVLSYKR